LQNNDASSWGLKGKEESGKIEKISGRGVDPVGQAAMITPVS
jgi:hypothetical protein